MEYHLGPRRHFLTAPVGGGYVRIADDLRKATVFLGYDVAGADGEPNIDARATGFFLSWKTSASRPQEGDDQKEWGAIYLITARHCAKQLGSHFVIRYNKQNEIPAAHPQSSGIEHVDNPQWIYHSDPTVDIAVMHWGFPEWADVVPISGFWLTRAGEYWPEDGGKKQPIVFPNKDIGIGDIAYVVGLFNPLGNTKINLPVVYTGHIALLPDDYRIAVHDRIEGTREVECYLVQAPGMDGLSGAPVFARSSHPVIGSYRPEGDMPQISRGTAIAGRLHGLNALLGLWSASWADQPDETLAKHHPASVGRKVPVGFGVVVPAYKIAETLNQPELIMVRRAEYERRVRESAATTDFASAPALETMPEGNENPNHLEDFTRLVSAASKRKPKGDRT